MKITVKFELSEEGKEQIDAVEMFDAILKNDVEGMNMYLSDWDESQAVYEVMGCVGDRQSLAGKYNKLCRALLETFEKDFRQKRGWLKRVKGIKIESGK